MQRCFRQALQRIELSRQNVSGNLYLEPGDQLPSFVELRNEHGISRGTVEKAHSLLEGEGLIVREHGRGVFVAEAQRRPRTGVLGFICGGFAETQRLLYWLRVMAGMQQEAMQSKRQLMLILNGSDTSVWDKIDGVLIRLPVFASAAWNSRTLSALRFVIMIMEQRHYPQDESLALTEIRESLLCPDIQATAAEATTSTEEELDAAATLTTLLEKEARSRRKEAFGSIAWSFAYTALMLWILRHTDITEASLKTNLLFCFSIMGILAGVGSVQLSRRYKQSKRSLSAAIDQINDKKQVAPLIRVLQVPNTPIRNLAKQGLTKLLPTLRASDTSLLGEGERKLLLRQLAIFPNDSGYRDVRELFLKAAARREMDLRLAILKALEQIGGDQELATVERLTRGLPTLHSQLKVPKELREAAKACLPYLQIRASEQREGAQLLRAASLPTTAGDDLLRPATSSLESHPEQLLRVADSEL